jgi:hypothetical protein
MDREDHTGNFRFSLADDLARVIGRDLCDFRTGAAAFAPARQSAYGPRP